MCTKLEETHSFIVYVFFFVDILSTKNCDWSKQLNELSKLPSWLYCQTQDDVLHHVRKQIPGMTTPQMFIKVPGVWTAAHEENNQFRSINVNHGPGPCEWAGVAAKHVPRLRQLILETHQIDIYKEEGRWMPPLVSFEFRNYYRCTLVEPIFCTFCFCFVLHLLC